MNKVFLIGNLVADPVLRSTPSGDSVCSFRIAVNRRRRSNAEAGQPEADFFRVAAWRQLGENCARYLAKGRKVSVVGSVSCRTYVGSDGQTRASLDVQADDVEFLTPKGEQGEAMAAYAPAAPAPRPVSSPAYGSAPQGGSFVQVDDDELPF